MDVWRYALTADTEMNIFEMRAAGPGPGPAARILKMFISRSGFDGGDPILSDVQWVCVYLCGLARIYVDLHGFTWILVDFLDFRGPRFSSLWQPVASVGGLWQPLETFSSPLKKVYGALEAWILESWRLGGLEAWSLVALAEAGGLEARGFEAGQVF